MLPFSLLSRITILLGHFGFLSVDMTIWTNEMSRKSAVFKIDECTKGGQSGDSRVSLVLLGKDVILGKPIYHFQRQSSGF